MLQTIKDWHARTTRTKHQRTQIVVWFSCCYFVSIAAAVAGVTWLAFPLAVVAVVIAIYMTLTIMSDQDGTPDA